jgi:8-oxo-dGTP pyrophosphatase MutT (NUDIX family)
VLVDACYRIAYWIAYRLMCVFWRLTHARTHGALIAIWHDGKVLLAKNSYVSYYCLPGGYLKRSETAVDAALRELSEELGLRARPEELVLGREETHSWDGKIDHVVIFDLNVNVQPPIRVDNREVVSAGFYTPEDALRLSLFPPLRRHIESRLTESDRPRPSVSSHG